MIQRIRRPDGTKADIVHGPSRAISRITGSQRAYGAVPITQGIQPNVRGFTTWEPHPEDFDWNKPR